MREREIHAVVAAAIQRHLAARAGATRTAPRAPAPAASHPSHAQFRASSVYGDAPAGTCVIEPAVQCVHCGYCRSQGH